MKSAVATARSPAAIPPSSASRPPSRAAAHPPATKASRLRPTAVAPALKRKPSDTRRTTSSASPTARISVSGAAIPSRPGFAPTGANRARPGRERIDAFIAGPPGRRRAGDRGRPDSGHGVEGPRQRQAQRVGVGVPAGEIEALPVADASVDVVISNCVINLCPTRHRSIARRSAPSSGRTARRVRCGRT